MISPVQINSSTPIAYGGRLDSNTYGIKNCFWIVTNAGSSISSMAIESFEYLTDLYFISVKVDTDTRA